MKSIVNYLFVAMFLVGIASCSDDDASLMKPVDNEDKNEIVGTWKFESTFQQNGKIYLNDQLIEQFSTSSKNETGFLQLKSDGTFESEIGYTAISRVESDGEVDSSENDVPLTKTKGYYTFDSHKKTLKIAELNDRYRHLITH